MFNTNKSYLKSLQTKSNYFSHHIYIQINILTLKLVNIENLVFSKAIIQII